MSKRFIILAGSFLTFAGCNDFMHDAPKEPVKVCGNSRLTGNHEDGKALFMANCATCHNPLKDATGPALQGAVLRWNNDTARIHAYIRNPKKMIRNDEYAKALHKRWKIDMTAFPDLTNEQIDAILDYPECHR